MSSPACLLLSTGQFNHDQIQHRSNSRANLFPYPARTWHRRHHHFSLLLLLYASNRHTTRGNKIRCEEQRNPASRYCWFSRHLLHFTISSLNSCWRLRCCVVRPTVAAPFLAEEIINLPSASICLYASFGCHVNRFCDRRSPPDVTTRSLQFHRLLGWWHLPCLPEPDNSLSDLPR